MFLNPGSRHEGFFQLFLKEGSVCLGEPRKPDQGRVKGRVFAAQNRQNFMADPVARVACVRVAFVLTVRQAEQAEQPAEPQRVCVEKRTQKMTFVIPGGHAAKRRPAGAAQKTHEHILGQITGVVCRENEVSAHSPAFLLESQIAEPAPGFLGSLLFSGRGSGHVQGNGAAGDSEPPAEAFSETGLFRRGRPQIVIAGKGGKRERGVPAKAPVIADQSRKHGESRGVSSP